MPADLAEELHFFQVLTVQRELLSRKGTFSTQAAKLTSCCDVPPV